MYVGRPNCYANSESVQKWIINSEAHRRNPCGTQLGRTTGTAVAELSIPLAS